MCLCMESAVVYTQRQAVQCVWLSVQFTAAARGRNGGLLPFVYGLTLLSRHFSTHFTVMYSIETFIIRIIIYNKSGSCVSRHSNLSCYAEVYLGLSLSSSMLTHFHAYEAPTSWRSIFFSILTSLFELTRLLALQKHRPPQRHCSIRHAELPLPVTVFYVTYYLVC